MNKTPQHILDKNKRYRMRNREAILYHKRNNRLRRLGLQPWDLDRMLKEQHYRCYICSDGPLLREGKQNLAAHIDHCHSCGRVRKILCKRCNVMVGFIESDEGKFFKSALYYADHMCDFHGQSPNALGDKPH